MFDIQFNRAMGGSETSIMQFACGCVGQDLYIGLYGRLDIAQEWQCIESVETFNSTDYCHTFHFTLDAERGSLAS